MGLYFNWIDFIRRFYMQTFLPYPSFLQTAKCLDYRRLGKQRVECKQIINILEGNSSSNAWKNHPAVLIWKGYENALKVYTNIIISEWINRGYKNNMELYESDITYENPPWLNNESFHASHRSNLLRKDYSFYSKFNWDEPDNLPYVWPSKGI
jgi:hypothetical protein